MCRSCCSGAGSRPFDCAVVVVAVVISVVKKPSALDGRVSGRMSLSHPYEPLPSCMLLLQDVRAKYLGFNRGR